MIATITTLIGTAFGALVGRLISRREYNAKATSLELKNLAEHLLTYQKTLDDMSERLLAANEIIIKQEKQNRELAAQNRELARVNQTQAMQITDLIETNNHLVEKLEKFKQLK